MTGKVYISTFQYYDSKKHKMSFKSRPVLVVGKSDEKDYVILPISRVTNRQYLDAYYDVEVTKEDFPLMELTSTSYIRTHKQSVVHEGGLTKCVVDLKREYNELYSICIKKMKEFQDDLVKAAL